VKILHLSYSNEAVIRLDHQILLKSPATQTLLAGPATAKITPCICDTHGCSANIKGVGTPQKITILNSFKFILKQTVKKMFPRVPTPTPLVICMIQSMFLILIRPPEN